MSSSATLVHDKLAQAVEILREQNVDLWLTLVRETSLTSDPCLDLIAGTYCAWEGAFLVSANDERNRHRRALRRAERRWARRLHRGRGLRREHPSRVALLIERLDPRSIALNFPESDPAAHGLTHGLWLVLSETLAGSPYTDRFVSSETVVNALRGRKSPFEVAQIRAAADATEEIFDVVTRFLRPGMSELEVAAAVHAEVEQRGLGYAWGSDHCPAVNAGPEKEVGHTRPGELRTRRGELLHMDFGVRRDDYCSDLRLLRRRRSSTHGAPCGTPSTQVLDTSTGVAGWEVDAAARASLVAAGYPEPMHALGHQLGRAAHDGGTVLAPRWDRYGTAPFGIVEAWNVFTVEYGTAVPGRGYMGIEEDVLVTDEGVEWLSMPQRELWLVP